MGICKNKGADQHVCFRYTHVDGTIPLFLKPLTIFYGCTVRFVKNLVGYPENRFSCDAVHFKGVFFFFFFFCLLTIFSHVGTEPPLPGYLSVLWGAKSVLLKDTTRWLWGPNPEPLAPESDALPLSHLAPLQFKGVFYLCVNYDEYHFTLSRAL